ncbi:MAG: radical SAM protein [Candidatus Brocadia sp.]|nr:SPASM domain-containing protein [Candidatus Brocadia sp.]MDG6026938.1 radical SAM protein [Candidatus Brocadia sp.]
MPNKDNDNTFHRIVARALALYKYSLDIQEQCPLFPEHVHIEPTNICNLHCVHCHHSTRGVHFTKKYGFMELELFKKVVNDIKGTASRITLNQQGEPLLHKHIIDMVKYAKEYGLSVSMLTNGTRLNNLLAKQLIDLRLDRIIFSFEGSKQSIHEAIRKGSDYVKTLRNILYFIKHNFEMGRHTFIGMSMVDTSYSHHDIDDYKRFFSVLPINTIFINPHLTMSGATLTSHEIDINHYKDLPMDTIPVCRLPWESIVVNWDGTVSPCAVDFNESHIIGDVNKESLIDLFNSDRMRRFRRCHIEKDYQWIEEQGPLCASCNCRFNEEYDLRSLNDYVSNYIVRQAKVFAPQLLDADTSGKDTNVEIKYNNLLKMLSHMEELSDKRNQ